MVKIMCGINSYPTEKVIGMSVSEVQKRFRDSLNIPQGARALINGRQVTGDAIVEDGVELEFVKETGEKGC